MTSNAGIVRDALSLESAAREVAKLHPGARAEGARPAREEAELANLCDLAGAVLAAAAEREESRGSHARSDFPETSERLRVRLAATTAGVGRAPVDGAVDVRA